jgi:hypothetical protein
MAISTDVLLLTAARGPDQQGYEEATNTSPQRVDDAMATDRLEDIHKPSVVAFQCMIDAFVRARQLK